MIDRNEIKKNIKDFWEFISDDDAIIKPIVIDGDIYGFIVWKQGHTLNIYDTNFKNTATATIGYEPYEDVKKPISFETFLKYADSIRNIAEIELKHPEQLNE